MGEQEDVRVARTESLFRDVNERIAETAEKFGAKDASFVCECDDPACTHRVHATIDEYEEVRADGARFLVDAGHVNDDAETVVEVKRTFTLIEKIKPLVRSTARRLDPRASNA
jgi:hypothetical protein